MVKLSDYGLAPARYLCEDIVPMENSAPEVLESGRELKSDVWSLGLALFHVSEQKNPFIVFVWDEDEGWLCSNDPPSLSSENWSAECVDFVGKCLVKDVKERWDVSELMEVSDCVCC